MYQNSPLISVIMPVYNAEKFVGEGIQSVFNQFYKKWELLIINDGSTDQSEKAIKSFNDHRIQYFKQGNEGVSAARNIGLKHMQGEYFCFLDADDRLPPNSLSDRLKIFLNHKEVEFVDGRVQVFDNESGKTIREYVPDFEGNPFNELISLSGRCFFGPTWMIKRNRIKYYHFLEGLTHAEDLLFYLSICSSGSYYYCSKTVYQYRKGNPSAMERLSQLERGYFQVYSEIRDWNKLSENQLNSFHRRIKSIMLKSYLDSGDIWRATKVLFK